MGLFVVVFCFFLNRSISTSFGCGVKPGNMIGPRLPKPKAVHLVFFNLESRDLISWVLRLCKARLKVEEWIWSESLSCLVRRWGHCASLTGFQGLCSQANKAAPWSESLLILEWLPLFAVECHHSCLCRQRKRKLHV